MYTYLVKYKLKYVVCTLDILIIHPLCINGGGVISLLTADISFEIMRALSRCFCHPHKHPVQTTLFLIEFLVSLELEDVKS